MRSQGLELSQIGMFLFKSERTISRWIQDFIERRMASIFSGYLIMKMQKNNKRPKK